MPSRLNSVRRRHSPLCLSGSSSPVHASQEVPPGFGTDSAKGVEARENTMSGGSELIDKGGELTDKGGELKDKGGELMDKVVSSFKEVLNMNEDTLMQECQNAISNFEKLEKEQLEGSNYQPAFVKKLQEHHGTLRRYIERLKLLESLRAVLISHLKELLNEQELKGIQIGSMIQVAESEYKRIDELCQCLGIDMESSSEPLAQEENSDEHNATTNVLTNLAAGAASATSSSPAPPETNWKWTGAKRTLTPAMSGLETKYIIAEDRDPEDVITRINEAMTESNPADGEYYFRLPGTTQVVFDSVLMQFCLPKREGYRIWSTQNAATSTKALRMGTLLMDILDSLKEKKKPMSQKGFYYPKEEIYGSDYQGVFCPSLNEVCMLLETSKLSLNIKTYTRGNIIGSVKLCVGEHVVLNPRKRTRYITDKCHYVDNIKATKIKFILVVEKHAVFDMLEALKFHKKHRCVVITGRGYPDLPTRAVVHKLRQYLKVPVFGLFDLDKDGLQIMFTNKYGSRSTAFHNLDMTVNDLVWIGMHPTDFDGEDDDPTVPRKKLSDRDCDTVRKLLQTLPIAVKKLEPSNMNMIAGVLYKKMSRNIQKLLTYENMEAFLIKKIGNGIEAEPEVESLEHEAEAGSGRAEPEVDSLEHEAEAGRGRAEPEVESLQHEAEAGRKGKRKRTGD